MDGGVQRVSRGTTVAHQVETAGWSRGEATQRRTQCQRPVRSLVPAFLGSRRAEHSRGRHASSTRQGGCRSLTAAGRGLARAVSEEAAAKVTVPELSDFSSFSQDLEQSRQEDTVAHRQLCGRESTQLVGAQGPQSILRPRPGPAGGLEEHLPEKHRGCFHLCISYTHVGNGGHDLFGSYGAF